MRIRFGLLIPLLVVPLLMTACGKQVQGKAPDDEKSRAAKSADLLIPVQAERPGRADISAYFETTARVQAENRVDVMSKGMGQCLQLNVEEGDEVKADEILAELDKTDLEAQIRQTKVNVQQSKYQMQKAKEQLEAGLIAPYEAENARFMYEQAEAALNLQEVQLRNQTIRAPIGGVVTHRNIQEGMLVTSGMPAFSIVDPSSYILPINPPEKELMRLKVGQEAKVRIDSRENEEFTARVRRINPSVDPMSGTVKVTLDFEPAARKYLRESAFARVRLVMETHKNAMVLPKDAIVEENARKYVMVVREKPIEKAEEDQESGEKPAAKEKPAEEKPKETSDEAPAEPPKPALMAERVEVQTGLEDSNHVEIISGLEDGSLVITLGQHTLKPGSAVSITNAEAEILSRGDISAQQALSAAQDKRAAGG